MRMNADSDEEGRGDDYDASQHEVRPPDDDRAFWRRRFIILCGGVVALGACAWLFPAAHQPSAHEVAATRAAVAALAKRQALPSVAYGSAWPEPSKPVASSTASSTASPTPSAKLANAGETPNTASQPSPTASASAGSAGSACAPADIVLSLLTSQPSYTRGERPSFSVYAVSTSAAACRLTYGTGSVQVVVTQDGHLVWDSTACDSSAAAPVRFTLGVPQVLTMVWNPEAAQPAGCAGSLPADASGTLDAVAMSHGQSSPVRAFKIRGLAAEGGLQGLAHVSNLGNLHRRPRARTAG
jgi:hypothetical protein